MNRILIDQASSTLDKVLSIRRPRSSQCIQIICGQKAWDRLRNGGPDGLSIKTRQSTQHWFPLIYQGPRSRFQALLMDHTGAPHCGCLTYEEPLSKSWWEIEQHSTTQNTAIQLPDQITSRTSISFSSKCNPTGTSSRLLKSLLDWLLPTVSRTSSMIDLSRRMECINCYSLGNFNSTQTCTEGSVVILS